MIQNLMREEEIRVTQKLKRDRVNSLWGLSESEKKIMNLWNDFQIKKRLENKNSLPRSQLCTNKA